jgi:hypothetical protein
MPQRRSRPSRRQRKRHGNAASEEMTRAQATAHILAMLRSPMAMMSKPSREQAESLARDHQITALDLLALAHKRARDV